ncbi:RecT family recombinase [Paenibacillus sp. JDR-2]|uniref:RecT family recombinase n=1 Tax=Paenibacillus sp. (strain JDR-2) TaxID=324057 RepID=UPI000166A6DF|nr:RecT family recombinase [Paenibacillus sp. JDR-2]ACT00257.1 RecT protein [Paenibacillus sp. JDR-2]
MTNNNKAVQAIDTQALVGNFNQTELETLKATIAKGTTNEQFALFVQTCARSGLNPFLNQIYCIVYNGKDGPVMSIQIAVEGIVSLAKRHPQYGGFIASEVKEHDEFEIDVVSGVPVHKITSLQRGKTIGAYCVAYRTDAPNIAVIITNDQVDHLLKGRNGQMWKDYFDDMIVKHAIKRAFKRQYGIEVAEDESVGPETAASPSPYERRDITSEVNATAEPAPAIEAPPAAQANEIAIVKADIVRAFRKLGVDNKEDQQRILATEYKAKGDAHTLAELKGIHKALLLKIEEMDAAGDDLE